jgi:hypothetical protein
MPTCCAPRWRSTLSWSPRWWRQRLARWTNAWWAWSVLPASSATGWGWCHLQFQSGHCRAPTRPIGTVTERPSTTVAGTTVVACRRPTTSADGCSEFFPLACSRTTKTNTLLSLSCLLSLSPFV